MSNLRQRGSQAFDSPTKENGKRATERPTPVRTSGVSSRIYIILSALVAAGFLYLKPWLSWSPALDTIAPYALCSSDGLKIYTVDATNSQAQCIVVHEAIIVDSGLLR